MKSLIQLLPLACLFMLATSCGPTQYASSSNAMMERDVLYDNSWELVELNGSAISPAERYSYITFTPNSNAISGYTSCNTLGGTMALTGSNKVTFTPVVATKNSCINNPVDVALVPALRNVDSWAVVDDDLIMYRSGKAIARWSPSRYDDDDLYGNWQLVDVSDTDMPFDVLYPVDKRPTIVFAADKTGIIHGTTGYNTISCPVKIAGN